MIALDREAFRARRQRRPRQTLQRARGNSVLHCRFVQTGEACSHRYCWLATAVFVLPPCWVMRGRHLILTAPRVNESSEALLDQT